MPNVSLFSDSGALTTNNMFVKERLGKKRVSFCVINTSWRQTYIITSNTKYQYTCDSSSNCLKSKKRGHIQQGGLYLLHTITSVNLHNIYKRTAFSKKNIGRNPIVDCERNGERIEMI